MPTCHIPASAHRRLRRKRRARTSDLNLQHVSFRVDLSTLGSGDLAGLPPLQIAPVQEWWPYRNQMLVTLAAMKVISMGATSLMIGCLASDGAHADGRRDFVDTMSKLMSLQEGGLTLEAPAIDLDAVGLIKASGVPIETLA